MKKKYLIFAIFLAIFVLPSKVDALATLTLSCTNVTVGEKGTCVIKASGGELDNIDAEHDFRPPGGEKEIFKLEGPASFVSLSPGPGLTVLANEVHSKTIEMGLMSNNPIKNQTIATITVRGDTVGTCNLVIQGYQNGTEAKFYLTTKFNVVAKPTTTTTTTRRPVTTLPRTTAKPVNPTAPTQNTTQRPEITQPVLNPLKLTSVKVDDFPVRYENGMYLVTTESYTEKVTISATADPGVNIIGTGVRSLATGKNVVELILRNEYGQTNTYRVVITRPDDTSDHDTNLTNLKIIDHEFPFDPNVREYTVKVPYDVKEIYILAETLNSDVNITGAGVKTLEKGKNTIYVRVSYGDLQSTDYVITVKRSYGFIILLVISILLGGGLIGVGYYALINRKALENLKISIRNRATADGLVDGVIASQQVQVNGQHILGDGKRIVTPTRVVDAKATAQGIRTEVPSRVYTNDDALRSNAPDAQVKLASQAQDDSFEIQNGVNVLKLESKEEN